MKKVMVDAPGVVREGLLLPKFRLFVEVIVTCNIYGTLSIKRLNNTT